MKKSTKIALGLAVLYLMSKGQSKNTGHVVVGERDEPIFSHCILEFSVFIIIFCFFSWVFSAMFLDEFNFTISMAGYNTLIILAIWMLIVMVDVTLSITFYRKLEILDSDNKVSDEECYNINSAIKRYYLYPLYVFVIIFPIIIHLLTFIGISLDLYTKRVIVGFFSNSYELTLNKSFYIFIFKSSMVLIFSYLLFIYHANKHIKSIIEETTGRFEFYYKTTKHRDGTTTKTLEYSPKE